MTWKKQLLDQGAHLRERAEAETQNVNEAHMLVHDVMTDAFAAGHDGERNLDQALTDAIGRWSDDETQP